MLLIIHIYLNSCRLLGKPDIMSNVSFSNLINIKNNDKIVPFLAYRAAIKEPNIWLKSQLDGTEMAVPLLPLVAISPMLRSLLSNDKKEAKRSIIVCWLDLRTLWTPIVQRLSSSSADRRELSIGQNGPSV